MTDINQEKPQEGKLQMMKRILGERSLNTFEAQSLGDSCLNTTISMLRAKGEIIHDEWEKVPNRFGRKSRVKRYWIPKSNEECKH
ncbi:helix-turn-helix domain-containing protein [Ignatzschineria sp. LJL83]